MKKPILISFIFVFSIITNIFAGNPSDTTYLKTKHYEGIIFGKNYPKNIKYIEGNPNLDEIRWNPTIDDIAIAEKILEEYLKKYCRKYSKKGGSITPFFCKNIDSYIRQYQGKLRNEQRILYINCFLRRNLKSHLDWKINEVHVFDGGAEYWYMEIDMDKREVIKFYIHGPA